MANAKLFFSEGFFEIILTVADIGEGMSKIVENVLTYFMDGPQLQ